jgi:hypothetical protein
MVVSSNSSRVRLEAVNILTNISLFLTGCTSNFHKMVISKVKTKVKLFLCLTKHYAMKACGGVDIYISTFS